MNAIVIAHALDFGMSMLTAAMCIVNVSPYPPPRNVHRDSPLVVQAKNDEAIVRKQSEAYTTALLKCDKRALACVLHQEYLGKGVRWGLINSLVPTDQTIALLTWNEPSHPVVNTAGKIKRLEYKIDSVRVIGNTATESGTMSCETGPGNIYNGGHYLRVWLKSNDYWQLVQEQYQ